jgi:DNA-directed RNA polymerase specialized sigma24 family protein
VNYPHNWRETPEERFLSEETRAFVQQAIADLPAKPRLVILEGALSDAERERFDVHLEICNAF